MQDMSDFMPLIVKVDGYRTCQSPATSTVYLDTIGVIFINKAVEDLPVLGAPTTQSI